LPDDALLFDLLATWAPNEATRHRILVENPETLYGFQNPLEQRSQDQMGQKQSHSERAVSAGGSDYQFGALLPRRHPDCCDARSMSAAGQKQPPTFPAGTAGPPSIAD
jgi:hypothetical protein